VFIGGFNRPWLVKAGGVAEVIVPPLVSALIVPD